MMDVISEPGSTVLHVFLPIQLLMRVAFSLSDTFSARYGQLYVSPLGSPADPNHELCVLLVKYNILFISAHFPAVTVAD